MTYNYDMRNEAKEAARNFINKQSPLWAVGWIVPAETQDDRKQKWSVCAVFSAPFEAEMFIDTLPQENRDRFFITRL